MAYGSTPPDWKTLLPSGPTITPPPTAAGGSAFSTMIAEAGPPTTMLPGSLQGNMLQSQPPNPMMSSGGPFSTMPNGPGPLAPTPVMQDEVTIIVTRLLDMPIEEGLFGGVKSYRIRVLNSQGSELERTSDIDGLPSSMLGSQATQTFEIPMELGVIKAKTTSKLLFLQVEHGGGLLGGKVIGRCQIHRLDPRSMSIWPYQLSDPDGKSVDCGIELHVQEGALQGQSSLSPTAFSTFNLFGSMNGAMKSMGIGAGQSIMRSRPSPFAHTSHGPPPPDVHDRHRASKAQITDGEFQDVHHGVNSMLILEGAKDLPMHEDVKTVMFTIYSDNGQKELRRVGLFPVQEQMGGLFSVDCRKSMAFVQAQLHFGGDAQEGSQYVKVAISKGRRNFGQLEQLELIGMTDPIKVTWKPSLNSYYEIRTPGTRDVLGGIYITHRLVTQAEAEGHGHIANKAGLSNDLGLLAPRMPKLGPPLEIAQHVSGRTGNFPPGSQEEAFEQAAINAEAQNRALMQRLKKSDPTSHQNQPGTRFANGWREWENLDALFHTMGPSPLALSDELGPAVVRGYQHSTTIAKEVAPAFPQAFTPADQMLNVEMLRMMYDEDPTKVTSSVRPVICKDPNEIAGPRDMSWCPDPPVYVPMRNLRETDKETLRLACYEPVQNAALTFMDVNPNYRMHEDIWGVLSDYKDAKSTYVKRMDNRYRRVKDDCMMA